VADLSRRAVGRLLGDPYSPGTVVGRSRAARWELLLRHFPQLDRMSVLDLGGRPRAWSAAPCRPKSLTIVDVDPLEPGPGDPEAEVIEGDACAVTTLLPGRRFDLVYSNSMLEHVGGHDRRQQVADAIAALGDHHWIQTPYRYFPVEPHWWFPGFQFLPVAARAWVAAHWEVGPRTARGLSPEAVLASVQSVELLSRTELAAYFPTSTILAERFAGLTKSIIATA